MGNTGIRGGSAIRVVGVLPDELRTVDVNWILAEMARVSRGAHTIEGLKRLVEDEERQFWLVISGREVVGGAITHVQLGDSMVVEISNAAGVDWLKWGGRLFDTIEEWAREIGAEWVTANVRMGLADFLKRRGMKQRRVELEKRL